MLYTTRASVFETIVAGSHVRGIPWNGRL